MTQHTPYRLEKLTDIHSNILQRDTVVEIMLPADYAESGQTYPLLILNDGQDSEAIGLKSTIETLSDQNKIQPLIIVAVHAGDRMQEYGVAARCDFKKRGTKARAYTQFVMTELIPYIEYRYPVTKEVSERAIAGFSLGGLSAIDIAWHQDYFGKTGAFSGSFWWRKRDADSRFYTNEHDRIMHQQIRRGNYRAGLKFWFQTGLNDEQSDRNNNGVIDSIDDTLDLIVELVKKGYRPFHDIHYLELTDGAHDLPTWSRALPHFLKWAFTPAATTKT